MLTIPKRLHSLEENIKMSIKKVIVSNPTGFNRNDHYLATIPFKKSEWFGGIDGEYKFLCEYEGEDGITVTEPNIFIRPFGHKWDDGSYKYGQLMVPVKLGKFTDRVITLRKSAHSVNREPFKLGEDLLNKISKFQINFFFGNESYQIGNNYTVVESNNVRTVFKYTFRLQFLVFVFYIYVYRNQDYASFHLKIKASDPRVPQIVYDFVDPVSMHIAGCLASITGHRRKEVSIRSLNGEDGHAFTFFDSGEYIGDGQAQSYYGNIYFQGNNDEEDLFAASLSLPVGLSLDWKEVGTFGVFGKIPDVVESENEMFQYAVNQYTEFKDFVDGDVGTATKWDDLPEGLTLRPAQTGSQKDFGITVLLDTLITKRPELIEKYYFMAQEESMRPGHYCEVDGSPVTSKNHPDWVVWDGRTHYHQNLSPDRLGKPANQWPDTHGWEGKDWEHFSSNLLTETALLYPAYDLIDELDVEAELYLAGATLPSMRPGWGTNGMGAARAVSRALYAMCKNVIVTDRQDILERLSKRVDECIEPFWTGKTTSPRRPLQINGPDNRIMPYFQYTTCWQEHMAPVGLEAVYRMTGNKNAHYIGKTVALNNVNDGWLIVKAKDSSGVEYIADAIVGHGLRWFTENPGVGITEEQYWDDTRTYFVPAEYLHLWCIPAIELVLNVYNDHDTFDVAAIKAKAEQLYDFLVYKDDDGRQLFYASDLQWTGIT